MYTSAELNAATVKLIHCARKNGKLLGIFLFGTDRVVEFVNKGFTFFSLGNDLHYLLTKSQVCCRGSNSFSSDCASLSFYRRAQQPGTGNNSTSLCNRPITSAICLTAQDNLTTLENKVSWTHRKGLF
eukprot:SAG31_NODE_5261_length_2644_cov_2.116306_3_plen_128_part_00